MSLPFTFRVSKYDPADRDGHGAYTGAEDVRSDHGPVEAAYLASVAAFAQDSGVTSLAIREPELSVVNFGVEPTIDGYGLTGLFADPGDYHDGAQIPVTVAVELLRAMLRDNGAWCRLEADGQFFVHVGYDQYVYVGSAKPCKRAAATSRGSGLFVEPVDASPWEPDFTDAPAAARRPADTAWWAAFEALVAERGTVLLEEGYVLNASRWHQVTAADIDQVRSGLAPRCRLLVWPALSTEVDAVLTDHRHPLLTGVLPDPDGTLRARWTAE